VDAFLLQLGIVQKYNFLNLLFSWVSFKRCRREQALLPVS